ncbi:MAG: hypothetical protein Q7S72_00320 [Candidatus Taylorbacteria bacterium]|nr:hypothetical protein [Candidatus Taylorbacteria bacterium]
MQTETPLQFTLKRFEIDWTIICLALYKDDTKRYGYISLAAARVVIDSFKSLAPGQVMKSDTLFGDISIHLQQINSLYDIVFTPSAKGIELITLSLLHKSLDRWKEGLEHFQKKKWRAKHGKFWLVTEPGYTVNGVASKLL